MSTTSSLVSSRSSSRSNSPSRSPAQTNNGKAKQNATNNSNNAASRCFYLADLDCIVSLEKLSVWSGDKDQQHYEHYYDGHEEDCDHHLVCSEDKYRQPQHHHQQHYNHQQHHQRHHCHQDCHQLQYRYQYDPCWCTTMYLDEPDHIDTEEYGIFFNTKTTTTSNNNSNSNNTDKLIVDGQQNSCSICGCSWKDGHFDLDCKECGGYALHRPCLKCDGKCKAVWKRNVRSSRDQRKASWTGTCQLHEAPVASAQQQAVPQRISVASQ